MKHLSSTTRTFVVLLIVTLLLTYLALTLSRNQQTYNSVDEVTNKSVTSPATVETPSIMVSTNDWTEYQDKEYPLSFSHPKTWTVSTDANRVKGYHTVVINPPSTAKNIYIYVSDYNYLALQGLKLTPFKVANAEGVKVNDTLVGAKAGDYYYTFDGSMNESQYKEFTTILATVEFN